MKRGKSKAAPTDIMRSSILTFFWGDTLRLYGLMLTYLPRNQHGLPPASDMIALTEDAWNSRNLIDQIIKDGKVQTYTAPTETVETAATSRPVRRFFYA